MDSRQSYGSLQALRGIAALLVVLFHLRIVEAKYGHGDAFLPTFMRFADGGVDMFFVISGFVMTTITARTARSPANAGMFLARRVWRIAPLYWVYTTVVVALMAAAPGMVNTSYGEQSILASYLLWPQHQLPLLTVGWTLVHEMYFYLVMTIAVALVAPRNMTWFYFAWGSLVIAGFCLQVGDAAPWKSLLTSPMTLEFIGGALAGIYWQRLPPFLGRPCMWLGTAAFVIGMFTFDAAGVQEHGAVLRTLVFGSSSILVVSGAVVMERGSLLRTPRWMVAIGDSSYSLYLSHVFVISATGRLWQLTALNERWYQHACFVALATIACIAVGWISYRWLERPLLALATQARAREAAVQPM